VIVSLGIDPGPVPGMFLASWKPGKREADWARAWQCDAGGATGLLGMILAAYGELITCGQVEEFRTLHGAGTRGKNASVTREQVITLSELARDRGVRLAVRHSSAVWSWATDKRLVAAGLIEATVQLPHARAASRHCLFSAVHDGGLTDPLSRRT
jgi:hypothetical protein